MTHSTRQLDLYRACRDANWDPNDENTFAEEIAHLHEEVSEAFRAWRKHGHAMMFVDANDTSDIPKPEGVPAEFADVLIGLYYNAERMGFDLDEALEWKMAYNRKRDYVEEGRQLHA